MLSQALRVMAGGGKGDPGLGGGSGRGGGSGGWLAGRPTTWILISAAVLGLTLGVLAGLFSLLF